MIFCTLEYFLDIGSLFFLSYPTMIILYSDIKFIFPINVLYIEDVMYESLDCGERWGS